ncbi:hypothetical protein DM860_012287 [Cuscuta australis]|uniref:Uncharacterized protein n=1 Tax=Cuscuta australis TaxID=267555 RepID=A0A328E6X8_9ASTE|nr:hypothetical protein DM860_012287 [Cuscuta australis]
MSARKSKSNYGVEFIMLCGISKLVCPQTNFYPSLPQQIKFQVQDIFLVLFWSRESRIKYSIELYEHMEYYWKEISPITISVSYHKHTNLEYYQIFGVDSAIALTFEINGNYCSTNSLRLEYRLMSAWECNSTREMQVYELNDWRNIIVRFTLFKETTTTCSFYVVMMNRKTRGMGAARKLMDHRRRQRWADKAYKKSHLGKY